MFLDDTLTKLRELQYVTDSVLIAYSGGKDSLAVLEIAKKLFKKVICFFMYLVPDLSVNKDIIQYAKDKFGFEVLEYPHWLYFKLKRNGIYCAGNLDIKEIKLKDIFAWVRADTGFEYILTGYKKSDSVWRRKAVTSMNKGEYSNVIYPIWEWNVYDVLAYLKMQNITIPFQINKIVSGVDLTSDNILWFYDNKPDDYQILKSYFPLIETKVKQREYYGIK